MSASKIIFLEITSEAALEATLVLQDAEVARTAENEVHTGIHPEWGSVHIVIPMCGSPMRLTNGNVVERAVAKASPLVMSNLDKLSKEQ